MKKVLLIALIAFASIQVGAQELTIDFTTTQISGAKYSPRHIFAVWVTNSSGAYQKTLMVYARERKRELRKWNSKTGGDTTDATTGETLSSHKSHTITWDMRNIFNSVLPNGDYKLCMEITSDDVAGPYREIDFTAGGGSYTLTPADGSNFKNITINYTGTTSSSATLDVENDYLNIYPNPSNGNSVNMDLNLLQESPTTIKIYGVDGKFINSTSYNLQQGINKIELNNAISNLPKGTYIVKVETNHYNIGKPLIIK